MDHLHAVAFQDCTLAYTILGPVDNIKSITREDLKNYVNTYYTGKRIVLAAAGGVNHSQLVELAQKSFGGLTEGNPARNPPSRYTGSLVEVRDDSKPFAHVAVAMRGPGNSSHQSFIVHLLQALTGFYDRNIGAGNATSSALTDIVTKNKLAHRMSSFSTLYRDIGLFGVTGVTEPETLEEFISEIFHSWKQLARHVTKTELDRAKTRVKTSLLIQMDGTTPICEDIGRQLQFSETRRTLEEQFAIIDKVTTSDISKFIETHVFDCEPSVAALGNIGQLPDYSFLRIFTQPLLS